MKRFLTLSCLSVLLTAALLPAADLRSLAPDPPQYFTTELATGSQRYRIRMSGAVDGESTRDPVGYWAYDQFWEPNLYVRLENIGSTAVVNPWLRRADRPDTRSLERLASSIVAPGMSERDRARALWEWQIKHRFHATTEDFEVDDAVKVHNCYGYTLCYNESLVLSDLWRAAGLRVRQGFPNGHSTAEVFYEGGWHYLDSDESIICLKRDNRTIASEAEVVADHDLMKRTHTYGPLHTDSRARDENSVALHYWEGERSGEQPTRTVHTMDFTLRPGESLTWAWHPGWRFHGMPFEWDAAGGDRANKRWRLLPHVMNGELGWTVDLADPSLQEYFTLSGVERRAEGLWLAADSGSVVLTVASAWPVVGGKLEVDFLRRDFARERVRVLLSLDQGASWKELWVCFDSDFARGYINLDEHFPAADPARYRYLLRFDLLSAAPEPRVLLAGFSLRSTLQMNRLSLPGLSLGNNEFRYEDQSPRPGRVRITHAWRELDRPELAPGKIRNALHPPDGGRAGGTEFAFRWAPPTTGAPATDYEFQLSEHSDLRWVLSPNFHKLIGRTADRGTERYTLPGSGLLNPGQSYYWRVRARSRAGVWGPWSKIFSFTPEAPAVPVEVSATFDPETRAARLSWTTGQGGSSPARWRIYGSQERGFTASDTAYAIQAGLEGTRNSPLNLLVELAGNQHCWEIPPALWRPWYRVAAVDEQGRVSGPSAQAELAHPLIVTGDLPEGTAGSYYQARPELCRSIGHLVSADENGLHYQMCFRAGDEPQFELSGAPSGVTVDPQSGMIAGFLPAGSAGEYRLTLAVTDRRSGRQDRRALILRVR